MIAGKKKEDKQSEIDGQSTLCQTNTNELTKYRYLRQRVSHNFAEVTSPHLVGVNLANEVTRFITNNK